MHPSVLPECARIVAPVESRFGAGPAGIFPLGLRGQAIETVRGNLGWELGQFLAELAGIVPRHGVDRSVAWCFATFARVLAHHLPERVARHFGKSQIESACNPHPMAWPFRRELRLVSYSHRVVSPTSAKFLDLFASRAHLELARRDEHELQTDGIRRLHRHAKMFRPGLLVLARLRHQTGPRPREDAREGVAESPRRFPFFLAV